MKTLSEKFFEEAKKVFPGGVHSPVRAFRGMGQSPIFFKSSQGAYLTSVDEKLYIDFCQSFGPNILGHRDEEVTSEVHKMVDCSWSLGACEPYSLELAEFMLKLVPGLEKVRFVCSGTEAVMSALRTARAATGRDLILKFEGCYHGHVDSMLVKTGGGDVGLGESDSLGVSQSVAENTLVAPLDDEEAVENIFNKYEGQIAALIIEPLPANNGLLPQRKEFLKFLPRIARKHGALIILDEVISGFRVGAGGMSENLEIVPDLVTYGKVIGGGFPVGCYAGKRKYMDLVSPAGGVYQAGTLAANPVSVCAGLATLKKLKRLNVWETLENRSKNFSERVNELFIKKNYPLYITQQSSLFWVHKRFEKVVRNPQFFPSDIEKPFTDFFLGCLKEGLYLSPSPYEVCFVSLAHDEEVLDRSYEIIKKVCERLF